LYSKNVERGKQMDQSKLMQKDAKRKYNLFRITDVKSLIGFHVNKENHVKKSSLQEELFRIYANTEGKARYSELEQFKYSSEELRKLRGTIRTIKSNLDKLAKSDEKVLNSIYLNFHFNKPDNIGHADAVADLNARLTNLLNKNNIDLGRVVELKQQKEALQKEYLKERAAHLKKCSLEYQAAKEEAKNEIKTRLDEIKEEVKALKSSPEKKERKEQLKRLIAELENSAGEKLAQTSVVFRIKYEIEKIKSYSYRTSKSSEIFSFLLEKQANAIINAVQSANNARIGEIIRANRESKPSETIPLMADFTAAAKSLSMPGNSANCDCYVLFAATPAFRAVAAGQNVSYEDKHERILSVIKKLVKEKTFNGVKFDDDLCKAIAVVLQQSLEQLCDALLNQVKSTGNFTFKAETFHLVLAPIFLYTATPYESLKSYIDNVWH
jgi:hypothetical protein